MCLVAQSCLTLFHLMVCSLPGSSVHGDYPGKYTVVGSYSLLQGILQTQGSNPGLLHGRWILYHLSHKGSPRILDWETYPFSKGSSQPRNWTGVSYIAGGFFTNWAVRAAHILKQRFSNVVPRSAASGSQPTRNLLGMQIPGLYPRSPESETLGVEPGGSYFNSSLQDFLHFQV